MPLFSIIFEYWRQYIDQYDPNTIQYRPIQAKIQINTSNNKDNIVFNTCTSTCKYRHRYCQIRLPRLHRPCRPHRPHPSLPSVSGASSPQAMHFNDFSGSTIDHILLFVVRQLLGVLSLPNFPRRHKNLERLFGWMMLHDVVNFSLQYADSRWSLACLEEWLLPAALIAICLSPESLSMAKVQIDGRQRKNGRKFTLIMKFSCAQMSKNTMSSIALYWKNDFQGKDHFILKNARWLLWSYWAHFNKEEQSQHLPAVVLHNVNTGICVLEWHVALPKGKIYDKCEQSKTIITHFAHRTKLKLTVLTNSHSTTLFYLETQGIKIQPEGPSLNIESALQIWFTRSEVRDRRH